MDQPLREIFSGQILVDTAAITAAALNNKPSGLPNPLTGTLDVYPAGSGVRQVWRDSGGTIWEREKTGATWTVWTQTAGFGAQIKANMDAVIAEEGARKAADDTLLATDQLEDGTYPLLLAGGHLALGIKAGRLVGPGLSGGGAPGLQSQMVAMVGVRRGRMTRRSGGRIAGWA